MRGRRVYGDGETGVCGDGEIPTQTDLSASRAGVKHVPAHCKGCGACWGAAFIVTRDIEDVRGGFSSKNACEISFWEARLFLETRQ